jgi:hypothetical protein
MISNDERGWILASVSGLACGTSCALYPRLSSLLRRSLRRIVNVAAVLGACLINLDIILHIAPRWRSFSIRESSTFLAASLSLSFGVMVCSLFRTVLRQVDLAIVLQCVVQFAARSPEVLYPTRLPPRCCRLFCRRFFPRRSAGAPTRLRNPAPMSSFVHRQLR